MSFVSPDLIRQRFSRAMSDMYRDEVPLYGALMKLVEHTNAQVLAEDPRVGLGRDDVEVLADRIRHVVHR